jgi:hypothetical protein
MMEHVDPEHLDAGGFEQGSVQYNDLLRLAARMAKEGGASIRVQYIYFNLSHPLPKRLQSAGYFGRF